MATLIYDPNLEDRLHAERRAQGLDRYDEVWDGVYVMAPAPNDEHQGFVGLYCAALYEIVQRPRLGQVRPGVNLTDRPDDGERNYRCPDVVVFLNAGQAVCHGAYWSGPPDFVVEIISKGDASREKLEFYERIGTRELLLVDRYPWAIELYRLDATGKLAMVRRMDKASDETIRSEVFDAEFAFTLNDGEQVLVVRHPDTGREWSA